MFKNEYTFIMIKPDGVKNNHSGLILDRIIKEGFKVRGLKLTKLSLEDAKSFYSVHKERPFYGELTQYMSSGPVVVACLERENAVLHWRNVIGATDPKEAAEGTIRKQFATSKGENAVHGSDSFENAKLETSFFFTNIELAQTK